MGVDRAVAAAVAGAVPGATTGGRSVPPPGHSVRPLQRHSLATPTHGAGVRLGADLLAASGAVAECRSRRPAAPGSARKAERGRRTRLVTCVRGRLSHPCEKGGADTGPSPVDRRNRQQTPPDLRRTRHPTQDHHDRGQRQRRHPDAPLGYDSKAHRDELRHRRIPPFVSPACSLIRWRRLRKPKND